MKFDDCPRYLQEYLNYMITIKNRSKLTVKNYYTDIRLFLRFLKRENNLVPPDVDFIDIKVYDVSEELVKQTDLEILLAFLNYTATERDNQAKSRIRKAVSLRQFFRYLTVKKEWFGINPAENLELPKAKSALPKYLTIEQAFALIHTCSAFADWMDYRDCCIITWFLNCGMRLSELVGVNVDDVHYTKLPNGENTCFVKILGKGNKERVVYLNDACVSIYERYLSVRPHSKDKGLFVNRRSTRISNRRVQEMIEEKIQLAGLGGLGFSVHKLRHTAATLMYQNGVDVRVLKEVLGHESLDTTQIYTHVVSEQMRLAVMKNPLSNKSDINNKDGDTFE